MKTLGKLKLKAEKMLSAEELAAYRGGNLSYCADSYMIRSCNNLGSGAMAGWSMGWAQNNCSTYSGSLLYSNVGSWGSGCSGSWYS